MMVKIGSTLINVGQWSQAGCSSTIDGISSSQMDTGWVKYRETWYFMEEKDGYMLSKQFIKSGDGWYYLKANGELHTDPAFKTEPDGLITIVDKQKEEK